MSRENVEVVRQYVKAFNAGGFDGTASLRHSEIEIHDPPNLPDADRYIGEAAARERIESYSAFGWDGQFHAPEYLDARGEVLVIWQMRGQAAHGGPPIDVPTLGHLYALKDGKVWRIRQYLTREAALEAAELSE